MKIAIVRRNGLGDLICTYPLVAYLQKKFEGASITLFVDTRNAPLIPYLFPLNQAVVFPEKGNKYWNLFRAALPYRKKFDLAISAKTSPMKLNNFFLYSLQAKTRVAYVDSAWHSLFINKPIAYRPAEARKKHQALKCLQTVAPHFERVPPDYYPSIRVPSLLKQKYPVDKISPHPAVLISATTTKPANRLSSARYASLLNQLHAEAPISVRIIGQAKDKVRAQEIADRLHAPFQMVFPRNFDEFMVWLEGSDLFFVGDGGVAHIGAAMGKKMVALYGETNPIEWGPMSDKVETLYHPEQVDHLSDQTIFQALKRMRQ